MSSHTPDHDRLLAETSLGDWTSGPTAQFARAAARSARRRHRLKRIVPATAAACVITAIAFFTHRTAPSPSPSSASASAVTARPIQPAPAYEIISDTQLLALVTDRPLLVVQNSPEADPIILAFHR